MPLSYSSVMCTYTLYLCSRFQFSFLCAQLFKQETLSVSLGFHLGIVAMAGASNPFDEAMDLLARCTRGVEDSSAT